MLNIFKKKGLEYTLVVVKNDVTKLPGLVSDLIEAGWAPQGGVTPLNGQRYAQAMVRRR